MSAILDRIRRGIAEENEYISPLPIKFFSGFNILLGAYLCWALGWQLGLLVIVPSAIVGFVAMASYRGIELERHEYYLDKIEQFREKMGFVPGFTKKEDIK